MLCPGSQSYWFWGTWPAPSDSWIRGRWCGQLQLCQTAMDGLGACITVPVPQPPSIPLVLSKRASTPSLSCIVWPQGPQQALVRWSPLFNFFLPPGRVSTQVAGASFPLDAFSPPAGRSEPGNSDGRPLDHTVKGLSRPSDPRLHPFNEPFYLKQTDFPCGSAGKESMCTAGDLGLIPGLGKPPGEGKGYRLQ